MVANLDTVELDAVDPALSEGALLIPAPLSLLPFSVGKSPLCEGGAFPVLVPAPVEVALGGVPVEPEADGVVPVEPAVAVEAPVVPVVAVVPVVVVEAPPVVEPDELSGEELQPTKAMERHVTANADKAKVVILDFISFFIISRPKIPCESPCRRARRLAHFEPSPTFHLTPEPRFKLNGIR